MSSTRLSNYLRSNRKRLALSQDEVAFLLGAKGGTKVCRYERFVRQPTLETALACEAIFQKPVSELFGGLYQRVEEDVTARARQLADKCDPRAGRKRHVLTNIANKSIALS